jgi:hypothetical protein
MTKAMRWLGILIRAVLRERRDLALENLDLRQQLRVPKRRHGVPRLKKGDRVFWLVLSPIWAPWREALHLMSGDTVVGRQRKGFWVYWTRISQRKSGGRPQVSSGLRASIKRMATANPYGGDPRIHGELPLHGGGRDIAWRRGTACQLHFLVPVRLPADRALLLGLERGRQAVIRSAISLRTAEFADPRRS